VSPAIAIRHSFSVGLLPHLLKQTSQMSLFAELQRRNVVRMAILYIVVSWLVLNVANVLETAVEIHDPGVQNALGDKMIDPLRDEPGFRQVLKAAGFF